MNVRRFDGIANLDAPSTGVLPVQEPSILNEEAFHRMISLERKRTERSRKPFLLMLLDMGDGLGSAVHEQALDKVHASFGLHHVLSPSLDIARIASRQAFAQERGQGLTRIS